MLLEKSIPSLGEKMKKMKTLVGALIVTFFASSAYADNSVVVSGRVTNITPVYTQVTVQQPTQVCRNVEVPVYGTVQGGGDAAGNALLGMIIGGVIGDAVSGGNGNATAGGAVIGGIIGADRAQNGNRQVVTGYRTEQQCSTQYANVRETIVNEYDITYNVQGQNITIRVNRVQGERAYRGQTNRFRIRYQLID